MPILLNNISEKVEVVESFWSLRLGKSFSCRQQSFSAADVTTLCHAVGLSVESEFIALSKIYSFSALKANKLHELLNPYHNFPDYIEYCQHLWTFFKMSKRLIPLTSMEGGGGLFLDVTDNKVYDLDTWQATEAELPKHSPIFVSFFSFIDWFLDFDASEEFNTVT